MERLRGRPTFACPEAAARVSPLLGPFSALSAPIAEEEVQRSEDSADSWEVKWEVGDHIMMRFNHRLFQFCIGFLTFRP